MPQLTLPESLHLSAGSQPVLDLATCLTSLGFAQVTEIPRQLSGDPQLIEYYTKLQAVQQRAKRNRTGLWSDR